MISPFHLPIFGRIRNLNRYRAHVMDNTEHIGAVVNFYALILELLGSNMLKAS